MIYDYVIVGGGIVGLSAAYKLLKRTPNLKVALIEKESIEASHQTSNNSGVIHSGIYYKPGSLKAINCRNGYQQMIDFCKQHSVPFEVCGKVIVATEEKELKSLIEIYNRGIQNGLSEIKMISKEETREIEPHVDSVKSIYVPYTGIIEYKEVCKQLCKLIQSFGGNLIFNTRLLDITEQTDSLNLITDKASYQTKFLINCAGLFSDKIAKLMNPELNLQIIPFRGEYYDLMPEKENLVKNLIYPVPDPDFPFLGVHFTRMMKGGVEAGPNAVLALKREGYSWGDFSLRDTLDILSFPGFYLFAAKYWKAGFAEVYRSISKKQFTRSLQKLIPEIQEEDLVKGGAGVRAQACYKNGKLVDDFIFIKNKRALHVCNAPSPAATASLAIADQIISQLS